MITRREMALGATALVAASALGVVTVRWKGAAMASKGTFEITRTSEEWRKLLNPDQYAVLREEATERPFTSPHNNEKRKGNFACAGCDLPLFSSDRKFESGTGWPSFWASIENAVGTGKDTSYGMVREEVHCRRCGGHLGHVFEDGPKPTGLRYCINGLALKFVPAEA